MTTSVHEVAAEIRRRLPSVGVKKLHKLLYYSQAHHAAAMKVPLFKETVSAWDMGPVVGQLWYEEKRSGPVLAREKLSEAELNTIGYVVSRYGRLSARDLEHLTHNEEPWSQANSRRSPQHRSEPMSLDSMAEYFRDENDAVLDDLPKPMAEEVQQWLESARRNPQPAVHIDTIEGLSARLQ